MILRFLTGDSIQDGKYLLSTLEIFLIRKAIMWMNDQWINALGIIAGVLMTLALIPQLVKLIHTRSSRDLSTTTYILYSLGVLIWMIYGIGQNDLLLTIFKGIGFLLSAAILAGIWILRPRVNSKDRLV